MITEALIQNVFNYRTGTWTCFNVGRRGYSVRREFGGWIVGRIESNGREHHQRRISIAESGYVVTTMQGMVIDDTKGFPAALSLAIA